MKKNLIVKLVILVLIIILLILLGLIVYKKITYIHELEEYIDIENADKLIGFNKTISDNQIIYSKQARIGAYIGEANLIRRQEDNSYVSNSFKVILANELNDEIKVEVDNFIEECKAYVGVTGIHYIYFDNLDLNKNIEDTSLTKEILNDGITIGYNFRDNQKSYRVVFYKEQEKVIAIFYYDGEKLMAKPMEEWTEEEKAEAMKPVDPATEVGR